MASETSTREVISSFSCDEDDADYDYFECEHVHSYHFALAHILLLLTFVVAALVSINGWAYTKYSQYSLIRFRCPKSIIVWTVTTEIYLFSRILYWMQLMGWIPYSTGFDIIKYSLSRLGLVGGILIYLIRAWMYYVTYKYDQVRYIELLSLYPRCTPQSVCNLTVNMLSVFDPFTNEYDDSL